MGIGGKLGTGIWRVSPKCELGEDSKSEGISFLNSPNSLPKLPQKFHRDIAMFLDVDGTLLEFAQRPDAVVPSTRLPDILVRLDVALGGALALISGRAVKDLDRIFDPLRLPSGGQHGLERRDAGGRLHKADLAHTLDDIRPQLRDFTDHHDGTLLEDKGSALALHYRLAPSAEAAAHALVDRLVSERDDLHFLAGKMVFEIKSHTVDKGVTIARFMAEPPFAGRLPVFLGDDVTDEDGFRFVNHAGGVSIRVGETAASAARHGLPDVDAALDWLFAVLEQLDGQKT
jgi:trehalose 6-phosphate phosphatase